MKLWIDDLQPAPEGWRWLKTSTEAIAQLSIWYFYGIKFHEISFDHDLGGDDTTRPVLMWMIEHDVWPDHITVHTANPVGREWLLGTAQRYSPITTTVSG